MRLSTHLLFAALVAVLASAAEAQDIWYQDNNLGTAGGMQADFIEKFKTPETFDNASQYIDVYMFRTAHLRKLSDKELTEFVFPYLERNGIRMALNTGAA